MKKSFRATLIDTVLQSANDYDNLVVLNADSARALKLTDFTAAYPDRMYGMGISEADMVGTAAGMAAAGLLPVIVGFSMFVSEKPFEQLRQAVAYPNLNVKVIATHSGLCVGQDGATHQALEDMAVMRSLPNFKVYAAADVAETKAAVEAMLKHDGPAYLRLGRDLAEDIFDENKSFYPGGADVLREGADVTIAACGLMVEQALLAASALRCEGINATVLNTYSVKPLPEALLLERARKTKAFVTAEDHSVIGGLGGAVCEFLSQTCPVPVIRVGVKDCFGESGTQDELYHKYGLTADHIVDAARRAVSMKG
ncbi:transketolase family protein [[Clostridium] hylemonae]|uniref:Transketolase, C-terminal domain protein n=2 Tax=[Clostridium] hylemonae DSM 15053 TaxID=553973 RepID=C0C247_9FIRM|nr:transketolase C-terminal domain-containing protein [[Clostridium] hylemonae]EEG73701.1 Transketolase, C-terminal domain protein [[Clostridium] hylemonae DSM 15053]QEK19089.1 1-deoxy-D-xylulose-5-phosphate synthase [[Clostridium] hylemonae DSM 15053]BDF06034.1 transketolase [[Clostridium] hylemonae]